MDITMPNQKIKPAVHPVVIFRQSGMFYWKNIAKLSGIYAIFHLPLTLLSLIPQIKALENQASNLFAWLWFLLLIVVSSWGNIALLLGAQKAVIGQAYTAWQSLAGGQKLLAKYLTLIASIILFVGGLLITGAILGLLATLLSKANAILAILLYLVLIVVVICLLVYFLLH